MSVVPTTAAAAPTPAPSTGGGKGKGKGKGKFGGKTVGGKGGRGKAQGEAAKSVSRTTRAGLKFPVGRVTRLLRKGGHSKRIGATAGVYLAGVLEYLCAEILELAGNAAKDNKVKRITPRHIQLAVRNDEELNILLKDISIAGGGVVPNIHAVLLPRKKAGASKGGKTPKEGGKTKAKTDGAATVPAVSLSALASLASEAA